jgi:hypothetical protein
MVKVLLTPRHLESLRALARGTWAWNLGPTVEILAAELAERSR